MKKQATKQYVYLLLFLLKKKKYIGEKNPEEYTLEIPHLPLQRDRITYDLHLLFEKAYVKIFSTDIIL